MVSEYVEEYSLGNRKHYILATGKEYYETVLKLRCEGVWVVFLLISTPRLKGGIRMKYALIGIILVLALALTSCSLVDQYLPTAGNETGNDTLILDEFNFTNELTGDVVSELDANSTDIVEEDISEEIVEEEPNGSLVLTTISATEGDLVSLATLIAEDPDGDEIEYEYSEPFNKFGLWQTNDGDEGKYLVSLTASDGILSTTEQVQIVIEPSNKGPIIDCPDYFIVSEGDLIDLPCTIYDKEGDEVTFAVSGFMNELTYQTSFDDGGDHTVVITATDGKKSTVHEIELFVNAKNRAPIVEELETIEAVELETITVDVEAEDPDGDELTISLPILFDEDGEWNTVRGDAGEYDLDVIVSDGVNDVIVPLNIIISKVNIAPVIQPIDAITVKEGETINLEVAAYDADEDELEITFEGFMTTSEYTTTYSDAGEHEVTIIVTDGIHEVATSVDITVENVNRPPIFVLK